MRPSLLDVFFQPIVNLRGIGEKIAPILERIAGKYVKDLLFRPPYRIIDRRLKPALTYGVLNTTNTFKLTITQHQPNMNPRHPYKILATDGRAVVTLTFFNLKPATLTKNYPIGAEMIISGKLESFRDTLVRDAIQNHSLQIINPDLAIPASELAKLSNFEPVYGSTGGLQSRYLAKITAGLTKNLPEIPEWLPLSVVKQESFPTFCQSLRECHQPTSLESADALTKHRRRLAFDELLAHNYYLRYLRLQNSKRAIGSSLKGDGRYTSALYQALPYELTEDQTKAISEIRADLASDNRMTRLLQGDVGSGKTIVALFAMLQAIESGGQAVIMAPTEILVRQHEQTILDLFKMAGIQLEIVCLTSKDKGKARKIKLESVANGACSLVVATHAAFSQDVIYHNLRMVVIDEQHRFGVRQRMELYKKGSNNKPDFLLMSATPIPRSLTMAIYGDLDITRILSKPKNRLPIQTSIISITKYDALCLSLLRKLKDGEKVFWVCPLIEDSEALTLQSIKRRHESLGNFIPKEWLGIVHGKLSPAEKQAIIQQFQEGTVRLLVATTVIEVGVDIPSANIMIIESAEQFGLAQLHQLRGRVGRGGAQAQCVLLYGQELSQKMRERLNIMRTEDNGFEIAEKDLALRGGGDILGNKQSGLPNFNFVDYNHHQDLLIKARQCAQLLLEKHKPSDNNTNNELELLLQLFTNYNRLP